MGLAMGAGGCWRGVGVLGGVQTREGGGCGRVVEVGGYDPRGRQRVSDKKGTK